MALVKSPVMDSPISTFQGNVGVNSPSSAAHFPRYLLGGRSSPPLSGYSKQSTPGQLQQNLSPFTSPIQFGDKRTTANSNTPSQKMPAIIHQAQREKQNAPPVEGLYDSAHLSSLDNQMSSQWASPMPGKSPFRNISAVAETPASNYMETSPCATTISQRHEAFPQSPAQLDPFYTQGESLTATDVLDECWITVFGFPPVAASYILHQFSQYGTVLQHEIPNDGNWMHIQYQTKLQAKKALSKNGKIFSGKIMIGVRHCIEKELITGTRTVGGPATPSTPKTGHVSSPLLQSKSGAIRPLTAAYKAATDNLQVVQDGKGTPQRNTSVVSKAMEYVFGW